MHNPSDGAMCKAITKEELGMARHCRRRTQRAKEVAELIKVLLDNFSTLSDSLSVPVLQEDIKEIWVEQQCHIPCL